MNLYTKTGDRGETGLFDGSRVRKDDLRVCAYGAIDELNAQIGVALCTVGERARAGGAAPGWALLRERLSAIQSELFSIGADLATPESRQRQRVPTATAEQSARLERWIDDATAEVTPLRAFVLPGGDAAAAGLHVCRTSCRRAEREIVTLGATAEVNADLLIYVNRLSDLLFAWARWANHLAGVADVPWVNPKR